LASFWLKRVHQIKGGETMFRKRLMSRTLLGGMLSITLVGQPLLSQRAFAAGGDFSLDFAASAPLTYNHLTGGGAFDDGTIGRDKDVVESLEGGDFACGDWVTHLTQIKVASGAVGTQSIRLRYTFTAHSTGQEGAAYGDLDHVQVNRGPVSGGDGLGGTDSGLIDDGGSIATLVDEFIENGPVFEPKAELRGVVDVTDLEAGEEVIVRIDAQIFCNGESPTGNLQADLTSANVLIAGEPGDVINVGTQTVPLKRVGQIKCPDPKFCEPQPSPK
jgi:hypothetical protein